MITSDSMFLIDDGLKLVDKPIAKIKICELGNQLIDKQLAKQYKTNISKIMFTNKGILEHVSIDLNGKDGAIAKDLSKPITDWVDYFDVITNFGTSEHVEQNQYQVFKTIHNMTKIGGVMIHAIPLEGSYPNHSPYHYKKDFAIKLAQLNGYKCNYNGQVVAKQPNICLCSILTKAKKDFMTEIEFYGMNEIV